MDHGCDVPNEIEGLKSLTNGSNAYNHCVFVYLLTYPASLHRHINLPTHARHHTHFMTDPHPVRASEGDRKALGKHIHHLTVT